MEVPPFNSYEFENFLKAWGVDFRKSSAYYAQSNGRAELAVKSAKRILSDNVDNSGHLDNDKVARALLVHRNTPVADLNISPAVMLFGRPIRDHLPALLSTHKIRPEWTEIRNLREAAMAKRHMRNEYFYNHGTKQLSQLNVGDPVQVQNQHGSMPRRWHTTGHIVEKLDNQQFRIRVDGSNRVTVRNRRFLRKILPVVGSPEPIHTPSIEIEGSNTPRALNTDPTEAPITSPLNLTPETHQLYPSCAPLDSHQPLSDPYPTFPEPSIQPPVSSNEPTDQHPSTRPNEVATPVSQPSHDEPPPVKQTVPQAPRRSKRVSRPRRALSPQMRGKTREYSDM